MKRLLLNLLLLPALAQSQTLPWSRLLADTSDLTNQTDKEIYKTVIAPFIYANLKDTARMSDSTMPISYDEADWQVLKHLTMKAYGRHYVKPSLYKAKADWYALHGNWMAYSRYALNLLSLSPPDTTNALKCYLINNAAWKVLAHVNDKSRINEWIEWMESLISCKICQQSELLSAYANLLYKAGRKPDAIKWQTEAVKISPSNKWHLMTLRHMIKGEPTY